ncbi:MAG: CHAT domain-containing protein [Phycisphaerales bacterium]
MTVLRFGPTFAPAACAFFLALVAGTMPARVAGGTALQVAPPAAAPPAEAASGPALEPEAAPKPEPQPEPAWTSDAARDLIRRFRAADSDAAEALRPAMEDLRTVLEADGSDDAIRQWSRIEYSFGLRASGPQAIAFFQRSFELRPNRAAASRLVGAHFATGDWVAALASSEWLADNLTQNGAADARAIPVIRTAAVCELRLSRPTRALEQLWRADRLLEAIAAGSDGDPPRDPEAHSSIEEVRSLAYLDLGLPDLATQALDAETGWIAQLDEADRRSRSTRQSIRRLDLLLAVDRYAAAIDAANASLAELGDDDESSRAALLLRRGLAESRTEGSDPSASFRAVLALPASPSDDHAARCRLAIWLINNGQGEEAAPWLGSAEASGADVDEAETALLLSAQGRYALATAPPTPELEALRDRMHVHLDRLTERWNARPLLGSGTGFLRSGRVRRFVATLIEVELALDPSAAPRCLDFLVRCRATATLARQLTAVAPADADADAGVTSAGTALPDAARPSRGAVPLPPPAERLSAAGIAANETVLLYFVTPVQTYLFQVDPSSVSLHRLPGRDPLQQARTRFVNRVLDPPPADEAGLQARRTALHEHGRRLAEILLPGDVRAALGRGDGLVILGLDTLGYVPFEALPVDADWLGLTTEIRYLPSLRVGGALTRRSTGPAANQGVVIAAPDPSADVSARFPGLQDLPLTPQHIQAMVRRDPDVAVRLGDAATRSAVQADLERTPAWIQFLVHGVRLDAEGITRALVLAPDAKHSGLLRAEDVADLPLPPLAILTACASGRGPQRWGDAGTTDLSGVAFRGGANTVLLPYAPLDLAATLELGTHLHRDIDRGRTTGAALVAARKAVAAEPRFNDPFYFALLHAHGLANVPVTEAVAGESPSWRSPLVVVPTVLALLAIAWAVMRRRR